MHAEVSLFFGKSGILDKSGKIQRHLGKVVIMKKMKESDGIFLVGKMSSCPPFIVIQNFSFAVSRSAFSSHKMIVFLLIVC